MKFIFPDFFKFYFSPYKNKLSKSKKYFFKNQYEKNSKFHQNNISRKATLDETRFLFIFSNTKISIGCFIPQTYFSFYNYRSVIIPGGQCFKKDRDILNKREKEIQGELRSLELT